MRTIKLNRYLKRYYEPLTLFVFLGSILVGSLAVYLTQGKILSLEIIGKLPTIQGVFATIANLSVLMIFTSMLYIFSSSLKLKSMGFKGNLILPVAIHSAIWEGVIFFFGLFSILSVFFKTLIPNFVFTNNQPQIIIVLMHYFALDIPVGLNLSMLLAIVLCNIIFAFFHASKVVIDGGAVVVRGVDFFNFFLSLILSKILFGAMLNFGFITMLFGFSLFILMQLLLIYFIVQLKG